MLRGLDAGVLQIVDSFDDRIRQWSREVGAWE
jgi:hypothetical protein